MSSLYLPPFQYHEYLVDRRDPRPPARPDFELTVGRRLPRRRWMVIR